MSAEVKLMKCTCTNAFQDSTYGSGMRVHNPGGKSDTKEHGSKYYCTVCKDKKTIK